MMLASPAYRCSCKDIECGPFGMHGELRHDSAPQRRRLIVHAEDNASIVSPSVKLPDVSYVITRVDMIG